MALKVFKALSTGGKKPFFLANKVHRRYMDINRALPCDKETAPFYYGLVKARDCIKPKEGYPFEPKTFNWKAQEAYYAFHNKAESIHRRLANRCKNGALWLDLHGQGKNDITHLGYGIHKDKYKKPEDLYKSMRDSTIAGLWYRKTKGVRSLSRK